LYYSVINRYGEYGNRLDEYGNRYYTIYDEDLDKIKKSRKLLAEI